VIEKKTKKDSCSAGSNSSEKGGDVIKVGWRRTYVNKKKKKKEKKKKQRGKKMLELGL